MTDNFDTTSGRKDLMIKIIIRFTFFPLFMGLFLFIPAGTLNYPEGYIYSLIIMTCMIFIIVYFMKKDPLLLERRMRLKEKEKPQKKIVLFFTPLFVSGFVVAGLDHRYGWSDISLLLVITANASVLAGYLLIFLVFRENSYASRVVEVVEEQKVIMTGPYRIVRHPMYIGVIIMYVSSAPALGSWWALIPFVVVLPVVLVIRLLNEEKVLRERLPGYNEYCMKTRYRLIPYIW